MSRIEPLEPPFEPEVDQQLQRMTPRGVAPIALFRTFAKNLAMSRAMQAWGGYELSRMFTLTFRDREIIIDRTVVRTGAEYEWGLHVRHFAERAGLTGEQLASLAHGHATDACWDDRDRLLVAAVDTLHDTSDVPDELWSDLAATFDEPQLLDLLMLTGWYHAISYVANAARVPLEDDTPSFASFLPAE